MLTVDPFSIFLREPLQCLAIRPHACPAVLHRLREPTVFGETSRTLRCFISARESGEILRFRLAFPGHPVPSSSCWMRLMSFQEFSNSMLVVFEMRPSVCTRIILFSYFPEVSVRIRVLGLIETSCPSPIGLDGEAAGSVDLLRVGERGKYPWNFATITKCSVTATGGFNKCRIAVVVVGR